MAKPTCVLFLLLFTFHTPVGGQVMPDAARSDETEKNLDEAIQSIVDTADDSVVLDTDRNEAVVPGAYTDLELGRKPSARKLPTTRESPSSNVSDSQWDWKAVRFLSLSILGFATVLLIIVAFLLRLAEPKPTPIVVMKIFSILLIIVSAVFLVVVGYSEKQIAPVIGLLGTMAGFILGRTTTGENNN